MADVSFPIQEISQSNPPVGGAYIQNIKNMKGGAGEVVKWNQEGFFIGNENFANAPFRVNYAGQMVATDGTFTGNITASSIVDDTFGLNGCFIKQIKTTDFSTSVLALPIYKSDGVTKIKTGLLAVIANWYSNATGRYNFLPGINNSTGTSYFSIQKDGSGNYEVRHLGANQASELPSPGYTIYTCLFSSDESTYY